MRVSEWIGDRAGSPRVGGVAEFRAMGAPVNEDSSSEGSDRAAPKSGSGWPEEL
jgi:hypothetical protein